MKDLERTIPDVVLTEEFNGDVYFSIECKIVTVSQTQGNIL